MRWLCLAFLAIAGCSSGGGSTPQPDMSRPGGNICPSNPQLCGGTCCGTACVLSDIDTKNCGGCGKTCDAGQICKGGACGCLPSGAPCGTGQTCCPNQGCHNLDNDINHCGACGKSCGAGSGVRCMGGQCLCGTTQCAANQQCCNGVCMTTCMSAMPDMATSGLPLCDCSGLYCPFGGSNPCCITSRCIKNNCCAESLATGAAPCDDNTPCQESQTN